MLTLIAPMVRTPAFEREASGLKDNPFMPIMEPAEVVDEALGALGREPSVVAGRNWRGAHFFMQRLMPRKSVIQLMGRQMRSHFSSPSRSRLRGIGEAGGMESGAGPESYAASNNTGSRSGPRNAIPTTRHFSPGARRRPGSRSRRAFKALSASR